MNTKFKTFLSQHLDIDNIQIAESTIFNEISTNQTFQQIVQIYIDTTKKLNIKQQYKNILIEYMSGMLVSVNNIHMIQLIKTQAEYLLMYLFTTKMYVHMHILILIIAQLFYKTLIYIHLTKYLKTIYIIQ